MTQTLVLRGRSVALGAGSMISAGPQSQTPGDGSAAAIGASIVAVTKPTDSPSAQRVMRSLSVVAAALQRLNVRRPRTSVATRRQPGRQARDKPRGTNS